MTKRLMRLLIFSLLLMFVIVACRNEEEDPTAIPTAVVPAALPTSTNTPVPPVIDEETGEPLPTAVPAASHVDPAEINWSPQVIDSMPLPNEELLMDGAITIRFDQPMNPDSVEQAMQVASENDGTAVSGDFSWPKPDTVIFTPKDIFQGKQLLRVTIDEQAQGQNGRALELPVEYILQTAGELQVSQTIPENGTNSVATDGAVTVIFNRPVVPLVGTAQQSQLPNPLKFSPAAEGNGEWTSTSIYRFVPDPPLAGATNYTVSVNPDLTDVTGVPLAEGFSWSFTTLNPDVVTVYPEEVQSISPSSIFTVTFNMPMNKPSTEAAISLDGGEDPATVIFNWTKDGRQVGIIPQDLLELETSYQLNVGASAAAASGKATLDEQQTFTYQTYPYPAVIGTYPRANNTAEYYDRGVTVQFASPMDWSTVENRIAIYPPPTNPRTFINEWANEVQIDFPLEPDTRYTVVVPATAADPYGNTLEFAYEWAFDTPSRPPIASFNLPQNQSLLSTSIANTVDIIHSNVPELDVTLYDLGLPLNLLNRPYDVSEYRPAGAPLRTWDIPIEGGRNEVRATALPLADGGTLPTGIYLLTVTAPGLQEDAQWWQNQRNMLIIADTNVVVKEMFGDVFVWVTDIGSGDPVSGRNLTLYSQQGVNIGTAVSDENGFARFDYYPTSDFLEGVTVISNEPGTNGFGAGNSQWSGNAQPWQFGLNSDSRDEPSSRAYLYTDRPIYRPGDTMYYKGIVRRANYGRYDLTSQLDLELIIRFNGFFGGGEFEDRVAVTVQPDGTFNGEYSLPDGAPLGSYQLSLESPLFGYDAFREFTVAEYRRPEFLVELTSETTDALRGDEVEVVVQAEYFFGGSAADLPVSWTVSDQSYFPDFPGPYYCWADCGSYIYEDFGPFGFGIGGGFLASGEGVTDADGRFTIKLPADLLTNSPDGPRTVIVEATVQDLSGFPITNRTEINFHPADVYVGSKTVNGFGGVGEAIDIDLKTVDWTGERIGNEEVEVVFYQREWEPVRSQEFGQYYTAWNVVDREVGRTAVTTDGQGESRVSFVPEVGGNYLAVATVTDDNGRTNFSSVPFWVTDDSRVGWQTDPNDHTMQLIPDQQEYEVGDRARILVQNPYDVPVQAWVSLERGNLLTQQVVMLQANSDVLEIPITTNYAPNVFVTVTAVKPVTPESGDPYAEVRLGMTELVVPPTPFALNVSLTPQEAQLEPGETAVFDIRTTDVNGNPVSADLSLALVDLAVLTLKDDNAPPILDYFYQRQPYRSQLGGGLFISGEGLPLEVPVQAFGGGGGGGDAAAESAPALREEEAGSDDDVRQDFPDTAYWEANIQTDSDGRATVEIDLPDTLTTWRLHSKANTTDTLVGQNSADIVTSLPLLIRPVTPRFMTVGDQIQLGAVLNNNTDSAIEAIVSLEAAGVTLNSPTEQTVSVPAKGQTLVRWETAVAEAEFVNGQAFADLTFRVEGGGHSDATKPSFGVGPEKLIPIVRFNGQDIVGTSGELSEPGRQVEAILLPPGVDMDQGSVDVVLSPSLAAALLDSLELHNNLDVEPSCPSSVADRLLPNTAVATLISRVDVPEIEAEYGAEVDTIIQDSISQLNQLVLPEGGWGWCSSDEADAWITAYALLGLSKARQIGYDVPESLLEKSGNYLVTQLQNPVDFREATDANRQAFFLYVLAELGVGVSAELDALFTEARGLLDPYAKALMLLGYRLTNGSQANMDTLLSDLSGSAVVSATGAHWEDASQDVRNLSSDIRGTAMVINALSLLDEENPLAQSAVRWLMVARTASHWSTGHETAWSILALTEWLAATGELEANYDYGLQVNLQPVTDGRFTRETIAESRQVSIPVPGLAEADPNYFEFRRGEGDGRFYYTLHMNTAVAASQLAPTNQGIHVERTYYDAACDPELETCEPIEEIEAGQQVRVVVTMQSDNDLLYAVIEDPLPAGAEAVDPNLETTPSDGSEAPVPFYDDKPGFWGWWAFNRVEYRDDKVVFLADFLPAGTYQYTYFLNTIIPGEYQVMPTFAKQAYFPEVNGRGAGLLFTIEE